MISKEEIDQKSRQFDIPEYNVQRDYVFGWLLFALYQNDYLSKTLVLKGGNCFRKVYFPDTRFSDDLDFSTEEVFEIENLKNELDKVCRFAQDNSGVIFETDLNKVEKDYVVDKDKTIYKGRLFFKDFYGEEKAITISVRLDITEFDKIYLPVQSRDLIHPYSDAEKLQISVRCLSIEELVANKMKCLIQRRHSQDLYDLIYLVFFNHKEEFDRSKIIQTFLKKSIFESSPGSAKQILLGIPTTFFKVAWDKFIICPLQSRINFEDGMPKFKEFIEEVFSLTGRSEITSSSFFPPKFRNLIMEAGNEKKLLKIMYKGYERFIEPYSLTYKRRRDGVANEYFYAWDRTGGNSGIGIKTFLNPDIIDLQLTEETYEPRYPIELSKAGEVSGSGYFQRSFGENRGSLIGGNSRSGYGVRRLSNFERKYIVVCNRCGKRFSRKIRSTTMNKHKDPSGYECYGRSGYLDS